MDGQVSPNYMRGSVHAVKSTYYINGDTYFPGKSVLFNSKRNPNLQSYLDHLTDTIKPSFGAVRSIYTPDCGHRVASVNDLIPDKKYVVGGYEKFRPYSYSEIQTSPKKRSNKQNDYYVEPVYHTNKYRSSGRIKHIKREGKIIKCWANKDYVSEPRIILLTSWMQEDMQVIKDAITERLSNKITSAVSKLYTREGLQVIDPKQIEHGGYYIAVPHTEKFSNSNRGYKEHGAKNLMTTPRLDTKYLPPLTESQKSSKFSTPDHSHPASSHAGSENSNSTYYTQRHRRGQRKKEDEGVFHAKPVAHKRTSEKVKKVDYDKDEGGVFRAKGENRSTRGAQEVEESNETKVELPVDQREAEEITDEEVTENMENSVRVSSNTELKKLPSDQDSDEEISLSPENTPDIPVYVPHSFHEYRYPDERDYDLDYRASEQSAGVQSHHPSMVDSGTRYTDFSESSKYRSSGERQEPVIALKKKSVTFSQEKMNRRYSAKRRIPGSEQKYEEMSKTAASRVSNKPKPLVSSKMVKKNSVERTSSSSSKIKTKPRIISSKASVPRFKQQNLKTSLSKPKYGKKPRERYPLKSQSGPEAPGKSESLQTDISGMPEDTHSEGELDLVSVTDDNSDLGSGSVSHSEGDLSSGSVGHSEGDLSSESAPLVLEELSRHKEESCDTSKADTKPKPSSFYSKLKLFLKFSQLKKKTFTSSDTKMATKDAVESTDVEEETTDTARSANTNNNNARSNLPSQRNNARNYSQQRNNARDKSRNRHGNTSKMATKQEEDGRKDDEKEKEAAAAVKIQAHIRGHQTRKQLSQISNNGSPDHQQQNGHLSRTPTPPQHPKPQHTNPRNNRTSSKPVTKPTRHNPKPAPTNNQKKQTTPPPKNGPSRNSRNQKTPAPEKKRKQYSEREEKAVTTIQAGYRGYKTRKDLKNHQKGREATPNLEEELAATKIQANFRGHKVRKELDKVEREAEKQLGDADDAKQKAEKKFFEKEEQAAVKIQSTFRGYKTRKELAEQESNDFYTEQEHNAAVKIQSGYRGYRTRRDLAKQKASEYTKRSDTKSPKNYASKKYSQVEEQAAIKIQTGARGILARKELARRQAQKLYKETELTAMRVYSDEA